MSDGLPATALAARPAHLRPGLIGLVLLGGTLGTAAREGLVLSVPSLGAFPMAVFLINVCGAFVLGVLLEALGRSHSNRGIRLFAGTGFLGGFTTYSALATGTDLLVRDGNIGLGILYGGGSLVLGLVAAGAGIAVAGSFRSRATGEDGA